MTLAVYGRQIASSAGSLGPAGPDWFDIWPTSSGSPWVRAQRSQVGYRIRYEGRADFFVDPAAETIVCESFDCPEPMRRHFLLDQVVPLMLSVDRVVLHASSVVASGGFAAFIGRGGAGKSTIALALARAGLAIGSDDGLLIEDGVATPSYASVRVWNDSAALAAGPACNMDAPRTAKRQYLDGFRFAADPQALSRLYVLDPDPYPSIHFEPIAPRDLVITLVEQSYRLALDDRDALARQLDDLTRLARSVPAWRLSSPRRLDAWHELSRAVIDHIGGVASEVA
jgi:hypothetical protein